MALQESGFSERERREERGERERREDEFSPRIRSGIRDQNRSRDVYMCVRGPQKKKERRSFSLDMGKV